MTKKDLMELRNNKVLQMEKLVEERSENMDEDTLATVKTLKEEVMEIDRSLEAIETTRTIVEKSSKPVSKQEEDHKSEFRASFLEYFRGTITNADLEQRIMQSGTAGKGLETVPDEFYRTLIDKIKEYGTIFASATVLTTANHGELQIPLSDDTANTGVWTAEGGTITPADFATSQITMKAHKVTTAILVSTELLEDAFFDIESYIASSLGVRLARTFESAFINGDGTGKPLGIIADPNTVNVPSAVSTVVDADDMLNAIYAVDPSKRIGAVFYVSDTFRKTMDSWKDTTGRPLLQQNGVSTPANGVEVTMHGYPVRVNYELGEPTIADEVPAIFGNPMNYWIRNIRNITVKRSDELYALTDEVLFTASTRLDAKLVSANVVFSKISVKV